MKQMAMTEEARKEAISKAIEAYAEQPNKEAIQLPYKDSSEGPFIVINVKVSDALYNPSNHRVKAQLESHPDRQIVIDDPFGDEAQAIIQKVLSETEDFEELKANLDTVGQRDPGVITRSGLLVNANTRLAALREIDPHGEIRAAVLPGNAGQADIDLLEARLQTRRDFKRDYTFPNEMNLVNDFLTKYSYTPEEVAKELNWAVSSEEKEIKKGIARVEESTRLYALMREIQAIPEEPIPLTFFDDKKQSLIDLDTRYEALKDTDALGADLMKQARVFALLAGCDYRDLRLIDGTTAIENLRPELEKAETLGPEVEALTAVPPTEDEDETGEEGGDDDDVDLLGGDGDDDLAETVSFKPAIDLMADSYEKDEVQLPSGEKVSREKIVEEIQLAVEQAAEDIRSDKKASKSIRGPVKALEDARKKARSAETSYKDVVGEDGFDHGKFSYELNKLKKQIEAIEKAVADQAADG